VILVDTSIWVDHLRHGDPALVALLQSDRVMVHPFVIGEIALGSLKKRDMIIASLQDLPQAIVVTDKEALHFIESHSLSGSGIGYVDLHLLASTRLDKGSSLWTRDKRLLEVAQRLKMATSLSA
jgi:predicted nucleic acid-binding protein